MPNKVEAPPIPPLSTSLPWRGSTSGRWTRSPEFVRFGVYVATAGDSVDQPNIADAASDLLRGIFGEDKISSRLVFGVASLPFGMPVELEAIFEVSA